MIDASDFDERRLEEVIVTLFGCSQCDFYGAVGGLQDVRDHMKLHSGDVLTGVVGGVLAPKGGDGE